MGGEEFMVLLKGLDPATAAPVLERLRAAVNRLEIKGPDGSNLKVTASFGYTGFKGGETLDQIVSSADQALYKAKREGRNRIVKA
jgi:diguanylate cyclase (GGDEF)-like protein